MKLYLAGPMTGIEDFNFPAFHAAAELLRGRGHDVINPAENFDGDQSLRWEQYLSEAILQVGQCAGIVLLPGWETSEGVKLEMMVANKLRLAIYEYDPESRTDGLKVYYPGDEDYQGEPSILLDANELIHGDRQATYGHPASDFATMGRISAGILSRWLESKHLAVVDVSLLAEMLSPAEYRSLGLDQPVYFPDIEPRIVALLMTAVKLSREAAQHKRDNLVDLAGYAGCSQMVVDAEGAA